MTFRHRTSAYKPGLAWFCVFAMLWATLLLYAGAYTTSIKAGMAFLDWPLSNSSINPDGWLTDPEMRAEHSHRLLGAKLGLLSIALVIWTMVREKRKSVRVLAWVLFGVIVTQGLLGGQRVLRDQLNIGGDSNVIAQTIAILHAGGAQIVVCTLVALAATCSRFWIERCAGLSRAVPSSIRTAGLIACAIIFVQIILGAMMRHTDGGLAIPTFPLTPEGGLIPVHWSFQVATHWLHRLGAVAVCLAIGVFFWRLLAYGETRRAWSPLILISAILLVLQVALGAATIWTYKNPVMASTHMLVGAFLLATVWMLTFLTYRLPLEKGTSVHP